LPKTVYTTYTLFNHHWIPGQVIVDNGITKLHVKTLAAYF